jgi:hypothetical protein
MLTRVALRAAIRTQILTRVAWLDCSEPHWRTAIPANGPRFCFSSIRYPYVGREAPLTIRGLTWRSQPGKHPFHRMGLGDDLIGVIAIDALKHAPLES